MRRTCVTRKVRRSIKVRGVRRSPEFFARSTDVRVPKTLIFPVLSTCGKGKLVFARCQCRLFSSSKIRIAFILAHEWVSVSAQFLLRKICCIYQSRAYRLANTNLNLIRSFYSKSNLPIQRLAMFFNFVSLKQHSNLKPSRCGVYCFDVIAFTLNKQNTETMEANQSSMRYFLGKLD